MSHLEVAVGNGPVHDMRNGTMKLYHFALSGHAHRARLFISLLGIPHELVEVDLGSGAHKTAEFLALNPFGQVPVLDDDGTIIADSNAILVYLATKFGRTDWLPQDAKGAATVQRWLSVAAGELAFGAAAARLITVFGAKFNPDDVIAEYGADTFRLYEMYMGPLEASKPWNTRDIAGVFRFLQRAWRVAIDERTGELLLAAAPNADVERLLHRTTKKVADDIERLAFNTGIAALIEVVNAATRPTEMTDPTQGGMTRDQLDRFTRLLAPFAPHMAEEIWQKLGHATSITQASWPTFDAAMLQDTTVELAVQVAGKVKAHLTVPADASSADVERLALAEPKIMELLGGKAPRKIIVVPDRLVNIVA
jgi:glutathione S-transferase